jgi:hypothetical protein
MAFTRKMLKALGIEDDKIEQIIDAHTEVTDALKADRDKYKEDAEKLPSIQGELDKLKKESVEKDPFEDKYNTLKKEYDDYKAEQTAKETKMAKEKAYKSMLEDIGVSEKRIGAIMKVTDWDGFELDADGKIKDYDNLSETAKSDWSDFIVTKRAEGAKTQNPPKGEEGSASTGRAAQLAKEYHENLYGKARE